MKNRILNWLGIPYLLQELALALSREAHEMLGADRITRKTAIEEMIAQREAALRAEFEARSAMVLEAAITAALKIARIVESEGQQNLKEYVDEQFKVIIH